VLKELAYKAVVGYGGCYKPALEDDEEGGESGYRRPGNSTQSAEHPRTLTSKPQFRKQKKNNTPRTYSAQVKQIRQKIQQKEILAAVPRAKQNLPKPRQQTKENQTGAEHSAADLWADLRKMGESNLECPFEEELRKMLPPAVISQRDINSLRLKGNNRLKLRLGKQTRGANCG